MKSTEECTFNTITNESDLPLIMAPTDVAAALGISKNTAYEVVHSKGFPAIKVGKLYRIHRELFIQWTKTAAA